MYSNKQNIAMTGLSEPEGRRGVIPSPDIDRSVKPIQGGTDYAHHISTPPSDFQTFLWLCMILLLHRHSGGHSLYNERDKKASYFVITFLLSPQIISCQYSNLKNILKGKMKTWRNTVIKRDRKMG